jgi:DNA polymerase I-like protein with 3'-5' exonuclease and polymerase domains
LLEVHKAELDEVMPMVRDEMERAGGGLSVPLAADIRTGDNWLAK